MNKGIEFYDIYDYIYVPFWKTKGFIATTVTILIILTLLIGFFILRAYKEKKRLQRKLAPWEIAQKELALLTPEIYETKKEFKKFYFDATTITKNYLEKRFSWDVIEKTDSELIVYLQKKKFNPELLEKLESVLEGALFVKFANAQALKKQAITDLQTINSLITATIPQDKNAK